MRFEKGRLAAKAAFFAALVTLTLATGALPNPAAAAPVWTITATGIISASTAAAASDVILGSPAAATTDNAATRGMSFRKQNRLR
ncbi:MAG: hypothetical protein V3U93_05690 [Alphaproteobacteria bacterium]